MATMAPQPHGPVPFLAACLLLACCAGLCSSQEAPGKAATLIYMIQPTFQRALIDENRTTLLQNDNVAAVKSLRDSEPDKMFLKKYQGDVENRPQDSMIFNVYDAKAKDKGDRLPVGRIDYDYEIALLKKMLGDPRWGNQMPQPIRAFDLVRGAENTEFTFVGIGFADTQILFLLFKEKDPLKVIRDPLRTAYETRTLSLALESRTLSFRISSATIFDQAKQSGEPYYRISYYDEAGHFYVFDISSSQFQLKHGGVEGSYPPPVKRSLSALNFDANRGTFEDESIIAALNAFKDPVAPDAENKDSLSVMKRSFERSFVEAISMFEGSLIAARGLFHDQANIFFINDKHNGVWPGGLYAQKTRLQVRRSVQAIEGYRYNGESVYHIFDLNQPLAGEGMLVQERVNYFFCRFKNTTLVRVTDWPSGFQNRSECRDYTQAFASQFPPIDVVYRAKCNRTYAFYQHMYQVEQPDKPFGNNPFTVVDWMRFPINAILYHKQRLYMFGQANRLFISKKISGCDFLKVEVESEHYQSDLLLIFASQYGGDPYTQRLPHYDSSRYYSPSEGGWFPPLDARKDIKPELLLSGTPQFEEEDVVEGPPLTPPPSSPSPAGNESLPAANETLPTTPKPARPNRGAGGSMTTVIIIAIILVGIICACIYYFYFANAPDAPPPVPRSILRKSATNGVAAAPVPVGSTLSPTLTVRSADIHVNNSAAGASPATPVAPVKSVAKSVASKSPLLSRKSSRKSLRSPGVRSTKSSARTLGSKSGPRKSATSPPAGPRKSATSPPAGPRKSATSPPAGARKSVASPSSGNPPSKSPGLSKARSKASQSASASPKTSTPRSPRLNKKSSSSPSPK